MFQCNFVDLDDRLDSAEVMLAVHSEQISDLQGLTNLLSERVGVSEGGTDVLESVADATFNLKIIHPGNLES